MKHLARVALALAMALPVAALDNSLTLAADNAGFTMSNRKWEPLAESHTYIFQGVDLGAEDCQFDIPEFGGEGYGAWEQRVIGIDVGDCRLLLEEGVLLTVPELPRGRGHKVKEATAEPIADPGVATAAADAQVSVVAASGRNRAWQYVRYYDPVGIQVNGVVTELYWSWNGSCVYSASASGSSGHSWLTGWERLTFNVSATQAASCIYAYGTTTASFRNQGFCGLLGGAATYTYYNYVRIHGYYNGSAAPTQSTALHGGCTNLLGRSVSWGNGAA